MYKLSCSSAIRTRTAFPVCIRAHRGGQSLPRLDQVAHKLAPAKITASKDQSTAGCKLSSSLRFFCFLGRNISEVFSTRCVSNITVSVSPKMITPTIMNISQVHRSGQVYNFSKLKGFTTSLNKYRTCLFIAQIFKIFSR